MAFGTAGDASFNTASLHMPLKKRSTSSKPTPNGPDPMRFCPPEAAPRDRETAVATAAYLRAQERQFAAGHELEDWLAAEAEVDRHLTAGSS
jgi:hypothetical protein